MTQKITRPITLTIEQLAVVSGGQDAAMMRQMQDLTNNQQTTAQKAAEKADSYIRA